MDTFDLPGSVNYDTDSPQIRKKWQTSRISKQTSTNKSVTASQPKFIKVEPSSNTIDLVEDVESETFNFDESYNHKSKDSHVLKPKNENKKAINKRNEESVHHHDTYDDDREEEYDTKRREQEPISSIRKSKTKQSKNKKSDKNGEDYVIDQDIVNHSEFCKNKNNNDKEENDENQEIKPENDNESLETIQKAENIVDTAAAAKYHSILLNNLKEFVYLPVPKGLTIKTRVMRDKRGLDKGLHPTYYMHVERDNGRKQFVIAARKTALGPTCNYIMCVDAINVNKNNENYVGKLKANGREFTLFDNGCNSNADLEKDLRRELGAIIYEPNLMGYKGPRSMNIVVPKINENGEPYEIKSINEAQSLIEKLKHKRFQNLTHLHNRPPLWNKVTRSYSLNFHGRVTQSSIKNFQIVDSNSEITKETIMQFGKIDEHLFTCDFSYPLCAIQAFAIALTSFEA